VYSLSAKGLLQNSAVGVAQSIEAWRIRNDVFDAWKPVFPECSDLASSDAWNSAPTFDDKPRRFHAANVWEKLWWHTDAMRSHTRGDEPAYQGYVHIGPAVLEGDRTIAFMRSGHALASELLAPRLPTKQTCEFFKFPDDLVAAYLDAGCTCEALALKPGQVVIWHKCMPHTGVSSRVLSQGHYRLGAHVGFASSKACTGTGGIQGAHKRKRQCALEGRGTCSDGAKPKMFAKVLRTYDDEAAAALAVEC
jgi:hypothetical protein